MHDSPFALCLRHLGSRAEINDGILKLLLTAGDCWYRAAGSPPSRLDPLQYVEQWLVDMAGSRTAPVKNFVSAMQRVK